MLCCHAGCGRSVGVSRHWIASHACSSHRGRMLKTQPARSPAWRTARRFFSSPELDAITGARVLPEGRDAAAHRLVQVPRSLQPPVAHTRGGTTEWRRGRLVGQPRGKRCRGRADPRYSGHLPDAGRQPGLEARPHKTGRCRNSSSSTATTTIVMPWRARVTDKRAAVFHPPFDDFYNHGGAGDRWPRDRRGSGKRRGFAVPKWYLSPRGGGGLTAGLRARHSRPCPIGPNLDGRSREVSTIEARSFADRPPPFQRQELGLDLRCPAVAGTPRTHLRRQTANHVAGELSVIRRQGQAVLSHSPSASSSSWSNLPARVALAGPAQKGRLDVKGQTVAALLTGHQMWMRAVCRDDCTEENCNRHDLGR